MQAQCRGITKSGNACKVQILQPNGYCRLHQDQAPSEAREPMSVIDPAPVNTGTSSKKQKKNSGLLVALIVLFLGVTVRYLSKHHNRSH